MGYFFQSAALFVSFTVNENLAMPLHRLDRSKSPEEINRAVEETLQEVGLEKDGKKMPSALSGGMQKRAGSARALILQPQILLVDEPSSGLDRITAGEIDDLLMKVKTQHNTTIVMVTQDIHSARRIADKFAVLDEGRLWPSARPKNWTRNKTTDCWPCPQNASLISVLVLGIRQSSLYRWPQILIVGGWVGCTDLHVSCLTIQLWYSASAELFAKSPDTDAHQEDGA